jgi:hypothetical protein
MRSGGQLAVDVLDGDSIDELLSVRGLLQQLWGVQSPELRLGDHQRFPDQRLGAARLLVPLRRGGAQAQRGKR